MTAKEININVGRQMRLRRTALGLTQGDLAKAVGVAPQQVQKYEKGSNAMNAQRLYEFATFLRVPVEYFFEGLNHAGGVKQKKRPGVAEERTSFQYEETGASDRESLEILKSFKKIDNQALRKRLADLAHILANE